MNSDLDVFSCPLSDISLIEASAGTGKTWNICGLYLRLLLEQRLTVDRILVVTFTKAATAELRERIRQRIVDTWNWLRAGQPQINDPFIPRLVQAVTENSDLDLEDMLRRLDAARHGFDEAAIFTIHGFCQRALADTPFAAGLPFALELSTDDQALLLAAIRDFWRRHIATAEQSLSPHLVQSLLDHGDSPEAWAPLLQRHLAKPLSSCLWPTEAQAATPPDADDTDLRAAFHACRRAWQDNTENTLLQALPALNANSYKEDGVRLAARHWQRYLNGGQPLAPLEVVEGKLHLFAADFIQGKTKKNQTSPSHAFFEAAQALLAARQRLEKNTDLARLWLLRRMLDEAGESVRREKRQRRLLSFDDMLANVHEALSSGQHPWLTAALKQRFPVALIDEFQDTDPLQFAIFDAIYHGDGSDAGSMFLVGDPKQAIYSFRNADLHTYLAARPSAQRQYTLRQNQRSVPPLIAGLNGLFSANPLAFILEGLNYEAVAAGDKPRKALRDTSGGTQAALQVWQLPQEEDAYLLRAAAKSAALQATAVEIARLIQAGRDDQITLDGKPLVPGQIAVLVKSHAQGRSVRLALAQLGVASVELSQESVLSGQDALDLQRLLAGLLEPGRPAMLHAALCTEFMGLDGPGLAQLRLDEAALSALLLRFDQYRQLWLHRGFGLMFRRWLDGEEVIRRLLARPDGERRMTNLLHLAELLQQAEIEHRSPEALLRWLAGARDGQEAEADGAQVRLESDRNLVQIVTIHKAKGLEYDFVFCPFLWDGYQKPDATGEGLEYHDATGQLCIDFRPDAKGDENIKAIRRRERDAEFLRLCYVALTRAVQRCYLIAGSYQKLAFGKPSLTESNRSLLNWLVAGQSMTHEQWRQHKLSAEEIAAAWQQLAKATPQLVLSPLPLSPGQALALDWLGEESLYCPPPPPVQGPAWRIGSFSSLNHGDPGAASATETRIEQAASDHDGQVEAAPVQSSPRLIPQDLAPDDILLFPRGPAAGDCLHAVLESIDFTRPETWDQAIATALIQHSLQLPQLTPEASQAALSAMLRRLLQDLLATPLPAGLCLNQLAPADKKVELEFNLPARHLSAQALNTWLTAQGYTLQPLAFHDLRGYLKGFIDLVFRHDGRYYLLDWKSNHLGHQPEDYDQSRMASEMSHHGYSLQYLLYSVALNRYLAQRLPDYDYQSHFGGVLYLFLRGVRPHWRLGETQAGVFFTRPPLAQIQELDALLAGGSSVE